MNKTNQILVVCAIAMAAIFASCEQKSKKGNGNDQTKTSEVNCLENLPEGTFYYVDKGRPSNALKYKEIVEMLKAYDDTRKEVLTKALGFEDTRVNTYPLQQLKDYLGYIENMAAKEGIPITGINIISAAYPKTQGGKEAGYQTLIFMPTTEVDGDKYVTFDPIYSKKGKIVTLKTILAKKKYNWPYDSSKIMEVNEGSFIDFMQDEYDSSSATNKVATRPPY